MCALVTNLWLE